MTIQRERLNRKNAGGSYDTIHLETQADLVLMTGDPSKNVEQVLGETVAIARGGTGATTAAAGLYALANELPPMTSDDLAEDDCICFVDAASLTAKKVSLKELLNLSGGGTPEEPVTNPNWPDKSQLTLGNTITWVGEQWIVSHVTSTEVYLTLKGLSGNSDWYNLQSACMRFANKFTEAQKACLKTVYSAGNTSGKVFVATEDQMNGGFMYGGFSYFNSDIRRRVGSEYWTSSGSATKYAWIVGSDGSLYEDSHPELLHGFRPSVCVDLTLYE